MAADCQYLRIQKTKLVEESYAETRPLLAEGRVEEARDLIAAKYRVGPITRYSRDRPIMGFWIGQMSKVQVEYYVARSRNTLGFFESQKLLTLHQSLGTLVRQFILELGSLKPDRLGRTLLHDAAFCQVTTICDFLLAQGYDPNQQASGNATALIDAIDGFEERPLSFDDEFDPFRVKDLFPTLLDAGADPDFPEGTPSSARARLRRMSKWYKVLLNADDATKEGWDIPDLERKIPLIQSCYLDVLEARRLRKIGQR